MTRMNLSNPINPLIPAIPVQTGYINPINTGGPP